MIKHLVFFRFKPEISAADKQGLLELINGLPAKIPQIVDSQAGFDVVRSPRAFDLALVMSFHNLADLEVYAKHEQHQPVIERAREICAQVASVDYEY